MKPAVALIRNSKYLLTWLMLSILSIGCLAADDREARLKAAFILNFAKFVEWPSSQLNPGDNNITFCFIGIERFRNSYLETFNNKKVKGKEALIKVLSYNSPIDECSVLFAKDLNQGQLAHLQSVLTGKPVLTVGETETFMATGGMIRFYAEQGKLRFEINPVAADRVGLSISSKLLNLARIRKDNPGEDQ